MSQVNSQTLSQLILKIWALAFI